MTTAGAARILQEFVNREEEMARFVRLLDDPEWSILVVTGGGGVGKSSLQEKMLHEVASRKLPKARVQVGSTRNQDYLSIMRTIRDDLDVETFSPFTDLINFFTVPQYELQVSVRSDANISVLHGAQINDSHVGDVAGVIVKDVMFNAPRQDQQIPESERITRLTDTFISCLRVVANQGPVVVLIDAAEKLAEATEHWLWEELLGSVQQGTIKNVKFVICGRREPNLDRRWRGLAEVVQLRPLTKTHIVDYLSKRGVPEAEREAVAIVLESACKGNLLQMATLVDALIDERSDEVD